MIAAASPLEQVYNDLLIGDVETVAEKLVGEIRATHPVQGQLAPVPLLSTRAEATEFEPLKK